MGECCEMVRKRVNSHIQQRIILITQLYNEVKNSNSIEPARDSPKLYTLRAVCLTHKHGHRDDDRQPLALYSSSTLSCIARGENSAC
jgi:hypothetical protein